MSTQAVQLFSVFAVLFCGAGVSWLTRSTCVCECSRSENDPILKLLQAQLDRCGPEKLHGVVCPAAVACSSDLFSWCLTLLLTGLGFVAGLAWERPWSTEPDPQQLSLANVPRWHPSGTSPPGGI